MNELSDVPVFAAYHRAGQWSVIAPAVRELSGRHGIRRIARVPEQSLRRQRQPSRRDHQLLRPSQRRASRAVALGSKLAG
jgi:hypothetical protein